MVYETILAGEWMRDPQYAEHRARYFGVMLDCGHTPAVPSTVWANGTPMTTGYGVGPSGETLCHTCCAEQDRAVMKATGKGFGYLSSDARGIPQITTWPGKVLADRVVVLRKWRDSFGGHRVSFRFCFEGAVWSGSGPGNGMYCRFRKTKLRSLHA